MDPAPLANGKLPPALLRELLPGPAALPAEVLVGPRVGEDACVIELPAGVLVAATDPITLTGRGLGRHAVVINANDVAVTGVRPRYFLCTALFPEGALESEVRELFAELREALDDVGAALVGGHTEVTPAVTQTLLVGQMLGTAPRDGWVSSAGVRPGDVVLQVGEAPVEGAAVLAAEAGERLRDVEPALLERARRSLDDPGISVVDPALRAAELGASALHDPTEGGLSAALHELAEASQVALRVDAEEVLWYEPGRALCAALGADPWGTLASGALLAAFPRERVVAARAALAAEGWPVSAIANAEEGAGVILSSGQPLVRHDRDELSRVL
jgi:hydrogenase maturation factor